MYFRGYNNWIFQNVGRKPDTNNREADIRQQIHSDPTWGGRKQVTCETNADYSEQLLSNHTK